MRLHHILLPILALTFIACSKEGSQDTEPPVLTQIVINGSEESGINAAVGDTLIMDISASDDKALGQIKIDIHNAFDGHGHGKVTGIDWTYIDIVNVSGTSTQIRNTAVIPGDALGGMYDALFRVLDASGNEGEYRLVNLYITSESQPQINITSPDFTSTPTYSRGDTLWISGVIEDDEELEEIHFALGEHDGEGATIDEIEFELAGLGLTSWKPEDNNVYFVIPNVLNTDHLELEVVVFDHDGNQALWSGEIDIAP